MAEQKFGGERGEEQKEETISPEEAKQGVKVTWTKEGVDRSDVDMYDAALVREGEILTIVGKYDPEKGIMVRKPNGDEFPANLKYLKKVK